MKIEIDIDDPQWAISLLRANGNAHTLLDIADLRANGNAHTLLDIADQIEAQAPKPRIEEPGWTGVVIAHTVKDHRRFRFARSGLSDGVAYRWICENGGLRRWQDLLDPVLVREGLES